MLSYHEEPGTHTTQPRKPSTGADGEMMIMMVQTDDDVYVWKLHRQTNLSMSHVRFPNIHFPLILTLSLYTADNDS